MRSSSAFLGILLLLLVPLNLSCAAAPEEASPSVSAGDRDAARLAIEEFAPEGDTNLAFLRIHEEARREPALLRQAALARFNTDDPNDRFAAVYSLSLTATEGPSADALQNLLTSERSNERMLAAAGLLHLGRREALPVLIAGLEDQTLLYHRDPPKPVWAFAQSLLLSFTSQDLGLGGATTYEAVSATKPGWDAWWTEHGSSLEYRPAERRFSETS